MPNQPSRVPFKYHLGYKETAAARDHRMKVDTIVAVITLVLLCSVFYLGFVLLAWII